MTAAAAASAIVREAAASAVVDVLEGESQEEKAAKLAAAKEQKMKKVIRYFDASLNHHSDHIQRASSNLPVGWLEEPILISVSIWLGVNSRQS